MMKEAAVFRTEPLCEFPSEDPLYGMSTPRGKDASFCALIEIDPVVLFCVMRDPN
jgi:hypothetical protein